MLISRCFMKRHECIECKPVFSTQTVVGVSFGTRVPRERNPEMLSLQQLQALSGVSSRFLLIPWSQVPKIIQKSLCKTIKMDHDGRPGRGLPGSW